MPLHRLLAACEELAPVLCELAQLRHEHRKSLHRLVLTLQIELLDALDLGVERGKELLLLLVKRARDAYVHRLVVVRIRSALQPGPEPAAASARLDVRPRRVSAVRRVHVRPWDRLREPGLVRERETGALERHLRQRRTGALHRPVAGVLCAAVVGHLRIARKERATTHEFGRARAHRWREHGRPHTHARLAPRTPVRLDPLDELLEP